MRKKLIIIEGPDNVGKSTIINSLKERLPGKFKEIIQPSEEGVLGFLRDVVKLKQNVDPFARQLLHTCSHINDAYTMFNDPEVEYYIMDRCYMSALVYGSLTGLDDSELNILTDIHKSVYESVFNKLNIDVHLFVIVQDKPFEKADESVYERVLKWQDVRDLYTRITKHLVEGKQYCLFSKDEDVSLFHRDLVPDQKLDNYILERLNHGTI